VPTDQELVDALDEVWRSIEVLGDSLTEDEWKSPSQLPGWSVQDNLVHLSAIEAMSMGRTWRGLPDAPPGTHVKNDFGAANERAVHSRRSWSGAAALEEFRALTRERIAGLRALDADGFAAESWTPSGPGTVRTLLPFRIFDSYAHEQDMRLAVAKPGGTASRAAAQAVDMGVAAMPFVVGKKAAAPDGSTLVFSLTGPLPRVVGIEVVEGRARLAEPLDTPDVRITAGSDTFERLGSGRLDGDEAIASGAVRLDGDVDLGLRVVHEMNYLF
jgi:uncharacterized protein (TIGR03083 family)